jgi:hypothetical protein
MRSISRLLLLPAIVASASCAQPAKSTVAAKSAPVGSLFEAVGTVTLHPGQPCAYQIMFDFHRARLASVIWLAAPMRESTILTNAARHRQRVHIIGTWRHGRQKDCGYVDVTTAEIKKSFSLF